MLAHVVIRFSSIIYGTHRVVDQTKKKTSYTLTLSHGHMANNECKKRSAHVDSLFFHNLRDQLSGKIKQLGFGTNWIQALVHINSPFIL